MMMTEAEGLREALASHRRQSCPTDQGLWSHYDGEAERTCVDLLTCHLTLSVTLTSCLNASLILKMTLYVNTIPTRDDGGDHGDGDDGGGDGDRAC